ncbi:hypothetical protein GJ633_08140 [Halorubrum sp. CBA1125]|uniref:hypothetical protein n=1 Tax=Halorubrum sp. CBA1125 TaxID=2668072 RepID=UPI0012E802AD|nr:hypothetical protein [Halorubrum sp. CBA1125]MUW14640.1 hypothetical protein [Halorubrum sp. CBA1125]
MPSLRTLLLGRKRDGDYPDPRLVVPPLCFGLVFAAYALGVFAVTGGVVFLAADAATVGVLTAAALAFRRGGLLASWGAVYAALLGQSADHYLLGLSGRSLAERLAAFLGPDGLVFLGVQALVLGTLAWGSGRLIDLAVDRLRGESGTPSRSQ